MPILYFLAGLLLVLVLWLIWSYNRLVVLKTRASEALSDIDVQLKRRFDLIPNLISTVKGYLQHEQNVLEKVTLARTAVANQSGNALERSASENALSSTLKTLFAVAENYPDLKANANFLDLQRELTDTENKIQASRRFYNTTVMELNANLQSFPVNLIATPLGFQAMSFFAAGETERQPVEVKF